MTKVSGKISQLKVFGTIRMGGRANWAAYWTQRSLLNELMTGDYSLRSDGTNDYIDTAYPFPAFDDSDTVEYEMIGLDLFPTVNGTFISGSVRNTAPIQRLIYFVSILNKIETYVNSNGSPTVTITGTTDVPSPLTKIRFDVNKAHAGELTIFCNDIEYAHASINALSTFIAVPNLVFYAARRTGDNAALPLAPSVIDVREVKITINDTIVAYLRADVAGYFTDSVRDVIKYNRGAVANTYPLTLINTTTWATGWVNYLNKFIFQTGLLSISGAGAFNTTYFEFGKYSILDRITCSAMVKFNDLNSIFGIYKKDTNGGAGGSFAKVDLTNNKLIICENWLQTDAPADLFEQVIDQTVNNTDIYTVSLKKNDGKMWIILKNNTTNETDSLYDSGIYLDPSNYTGQQWGKFGIAHLGGDVEISNLKIETDFPDTPKYAIYGDSLVEGNSLVGYGNAYDDRWCAKLYNHFHGDVLISGQGGARAANILTIMDFDLDYFSPEKVIVVVGLNDTVYATWKTGIDSIITKILARGATPIVCTITPRDDRQEFINLANDYILNTLSLSYQVIDFAQLLTVGGDRLTRIDALFLAAGVHPNVAGHLAKYNYCLTQLT